MKTVDSYGLRIPYDDGDSDLRRPGPVIPRKATAEELRRFDSVKPYRRPPFANANGMYREGVVYI